VSVLGPTSPEKRRKIIEALTLWFQGLGFRV